MKRFLFLGLVMLLFSPPSSNAVTRSNPEYYSPGGVTLSLTEPDGSIYRSGEQVRFTYTTDTDGYIVIFDIDTEGYVHLLSPANGTLAQKASAGKKYVLPDYGESSLIVAGPTGMELVFALLIPDRNQINEEELGFLSDNENLSPDKRFRIDGDPLLAANTIASELVRSISQFDGISLAYTYFYINDHVDYPRYLCAECHEGTTNPYERPCDVYEFTGDFTKTAKLSYPLQRGFEVAKIDSEDRNQQGTVGQDQSDEPETNIYVAFYPYDSYVYTPRTLYSFYAYDPWYWTPLWADPWWNWDPYYPGYRRSSFYFAWGWNWGSWGWNYWDPYRYSSWWYPRYYPHHGNRYYNDWYRGDYAFRPFRPQKYRYKNDLLAATARNASRDRNLLISSVRSKDRNAAEPSRYYKARGTGDRTRTYGSVIKDRTKSRSIYSERLKDRSQDFIVRDRPHIYNERFGKSRSVVQPRRPATTRNQKSPVYRMREKTQDRSKAPVSTKSRDKRTYNPQKQRSSSPPAQMKNPSRGRSSGQSNSSSKSIRNSNSRSRSSNASGSSSNRSSSRSSSRSKSSGKSRK